MFSNETPRKRAKRNVNVDIALATWWADNPYRVKHPRDGLYPFQTKKEWMLRMFSETGVVMRNVERMYGKTKFIEEKYTKTKKWLENTGAQALQMHGKDFLEDTVSRMCPWYYILDRVFGNKQEINKTESNANNGEEELIIDPSSPEMNDNFGSDEENDAEFEDFSNDSRVQSTANKLPLRICETATISNFQNGNLGETHSSKNVSNDRERESHVAEELPVVTAEKLELRKIEMKLEWKKEKLRMKLRNKVEMLDKRLEWESKIMNERYKLENEKMLLKKRHDAEMASYRIKELELQMQLNTSGAHTIKS